MGGAWAPPAPPLATLLIVSECDICFKFQKEHQREPLIPHDIPNARFYKIGVDIMTFKSVDRSVVEDYFSKFPEMLELPDKTAATVIKNLKSVFARFGIPNKIVSDNMPFQSAHFLKFANDWGFETSISSPNFPSEQWSGRTNHSNS